MPLMYKKDYRTKCGNIVHICDCGNETYIKDCNYTYPITHICPKCKKEYIEVYADKTIFLAKAEELVSENKEIINQILSNENDYIKTFISVEMAKVKMVIINELIDELIEKHNIMNKEKENK